MIPRSRDKDGHESKDEVFLRRVLELGYDRDDVTFMKRLIDDFLEFKFIKGRKFAFRPSRTIVIGSYEPDWRLLLLHEVGHAVSGHKSFKVDIERVQMEVEAWEKARGLATTYGVDWDEEVAQSELDTYRGWLHQKSRCPRCGLTRVETTDGQYHCPQCDL